MTSKLPEEYRISPARYAKKMVAVRITPNGTGYKDRLGRLAEHLKARCSHRESAYIMSESKGRKFVALVEAGRDAYSISGDLVPLDPA